MNRLKEHKGISLLLRYKKEMLRRMDCLLDLDYHYMVLRRDYGNRFVITEFLQKALSIVVVSFNRFIKDACTISASALTFYSILSFIPLMASKTRRLNKSTRFSRWYISMGEIFIFRELASRAITAK